MSYDKAKVLVTDKEFNFKWEGDGFKTYISFNDSAYSVWVRNPFTQDELFEHGYDLRE